jgi:hypothetical protein
MGAFSVRRLARFDPTGESDALVPKILALYSKLCKTFKRNLVANHLRSVCNQWCTSRRFQSRSRPCVFFCGGGEDSIEHCLSCPRLQALFHDYFAFAGQKFNTLDIITLSLSNPDTSPSDEYLLVFNQIAYLMYNSCRHGGLCNTRHLTRTLKTMAQHCPSVRHLIYRWRQKRSVARELGA